MPVRWRQLFSLNFRNRWKIMTSSHDNVFFQEKPNNLQWMFIFCLEENHWKKFFFSSKTFGSYNRSHSLNQLCMCVCVKNNVAKTSKLHYYEKRMKGNVFQWSAFENKNKKKVWCLCLCVCVCDKIKFCCYYNQLIHPYKMMMKNDSSLINIHILQRFSNSIFCSWTTVCKRLNYCIIYDWWS